MKLSLKGLAVHDNLAFGLWLFAGLLPWIAFSSGLMQSASSVISQPNLVKKVVFPLALLPLVPVLSAFVESTFGMGALIVFVALASHKLQWTLALLPLVWIPQLLFTIGLSYLAAGLTVFLRDIPQTLAVILNLWMYATPIIYPASSIPEGIRQWVFWLNPMAAVAETYRDLVLVGKLQHLGEWSVTFLMSVGIVLLGLTSYHKLRPAFADVL